MKCSFCGRGIDNTTDSAVSVAGKEYHLCAPCQSAASKAESVFEARRREGEAYFGTILDTVELSPEAAAIVNYLAGSPMKQADIEKKMLSRDNGLDRQEEKQQQAEQAIRDGLAGKEETEEQEEQEEQNEPEADEGKKKTGRTEQASLFCSSCLWRWQSSSIASPWRTTITSPISRRRCSRQRALWPASSAWPRGGLYAP